MSDREYGDDVWAELPEVWGDIRGRRLIRDEGGRLSGAVWELPPDSRGVDYHFHHGTEKFVIVLRGTATLRTPEGEREPSSVPGQGRVRRVREADVAGRGPVLRAPAAQRALSSNGATTGTSRCG